MKRKTALAILKSKTTSEQLGREGVGVMPSNFNQSKKEKLGGKGVGVNILIKTKEKQEAIGVMPSNFNKSIMKQLKGE